MIETRGHVSGPFACADRVGCITGPHGVGTAEEQLGGYRDAIAAALRACSEAGVAIPDDVSIVGFGDLRWADFTQPSITTVRQPTDEIGAVTAWSLAPRERRRVATSSIAMRWYATLDPSSSLITRAEYGEVLLSHPGEVGEETGGMLRDVACRDHGERPVRGAWQGEHVAAPLEQP
ncbi:HTH-type transcriptional regulator DegA [mine drainage metagenome]|uniref:HTH-type transcriptional regulator DegA n=1 Tax=mine drainage metagenome TaxID=410659 RepID=A0A1J5QPZ6_9ZZZZ